MSDRVTQRCDEVRSLGKDQLSAGVSGRDARGAVESEWRPLWDAAARNGILRLALSKENGGEGFTYLEASRILRALGEGCRDNGLLLSLNGQIWPVQMSIIEFGSEEQKSRWLPGLGEGSCICCHAVTETVSGSNVSAIQTTAERTEDGYRIDGEKVWVGMAPVANLAQVFAVTDPSKGQWGISAFLVDMNTPGIHRTMPIEKTGHRTVPTGGISFKKVEVPEDALLGREGSGHAIFNRTMIWERSFIFSSHVGAMKRQINEATEFAKKRAPGGTPIISYQTVSNRLADMQLRYETARLFVENAAREIDEGTENRMTPPMVKVQVGEALLANAMDAQRIYASHGYQQGESERFLRDMSGVVTLGGTSDVQKLVISTLMKSGL